MHTIEASPFFVLAGIVAGAADPALILIFVLNRLVALCAAMTCTELGCCVHDSGGGCSWVKKVG